MSVIAARLDEVLARQVRTATGQRVQNLSVELVEGRVVVRGTARSFHIKQLATAGVRGVLPDAPLKNAIVVE